MREGEEWTPDRRENDRSKNDASARVKEWLIERGEGRKEWEEEDQEAHRQKR